MRLPESSQKIMKAPFSNFWLRFAALFMGLLLWFHVATEKTYNYRVKLPVSEVIVRENLALVSKPPDSITVTVSATGKHLLRRDWKKAGIRINAAQYSPGTYNVDLTTSNALLADAGIISLDEVIKPGSFLLDIDFLDQARAVVTPNLIITPDDGFAIKSVQRPNPYEITVQGARSLVQAITGLTTEQKEVSGLRNNVEVTLEVKHPEGYGLTIEPDSVQVSIEVVPVKTRLFENIPVIVYNSPTGKKVRPQPSTVDIEMTGPPDEINLLNRNALIASVDFGEFKTIDSVFIKIDCPNRFKVKRSSAQYVRLALN